MTEPSDGLEPVIPEISPVAKEEKTLEPCETVHEGKNEPAVAVLGDPCDYCDKVLNGPKALAKHIREVHNKSAPKCEEHTWKPYYIIHAGAGRKPPDDYVEHACPKCPWIAETQEQVDQHLEEAHKPKPRLECGHCDKTFGRKWDLNLHVKCVHLRIRDHKCPECDYASAEKGRIQKHLQTVHWNVRSFPCRQCNYVAKHKSGLNLHKKAVHLKIKNFKCDYCEYTASQLVGVQKHMNAKHLNERPHKCDQCDFRALSASNVRKHVRIKHDKIRDFLCQECGFAAATSFQLRDHVRRKHLEKKRRRTKPIMVTGYKLKEEIVQQMARNAATAAAEAAAAAAAAAPAAAPAAPTPNNTEFRMTLKGGIVVEKL